MRWYVFWSAEWIGVSHLIVISKLLQNRGFFVYCLSHLENRTENTTRLVCFLIANTELRSSRHRIQLCFFLLNNYRLVLAYLHFLHSNAFRILQDISQQYFYFFCTCSLDVISAFQCNVDFYLTFSFDIFRSLIHIVL